MAPEDDGSVWSHVFGDFDQPYHLRIVYDDHLGAAFGRWAERSFWREPVAFCVFYNPVGDLVAVRFAQAFVWFGHALEDVVVGFGNAEDPRSWFGNEPGARC